VAHPARRDEITNFGVAAALHGGRAQSRNMLLPLFTVKTMQFLCYIPTFNDEVFQRQRAQQQHDAQRPSKPSIPSHVTYNQTVVCSKEGTHLRCYRPILRIASQDCPAAGQQARHAHMFCCEFGQEADCANSALAAPRLFKLTLSPLRGCELYGPVLDLRPLAPILSYPRNSIQDLSCPP
jgi:hypothetical protein